MEFENFDPTHNVNFAKTRNFGEKIKTDLTETFFPDDPFKGFSEESPKKRLIKGIKYFVPIFEWLPSYNFRLFRYDFLAGVTIASLAIPQGISYANLARIPPVIGLYSSFVPPFIYAVFGSSKNLAVGTVAACSLLIANTIGGTVSPTENPTLYLNLVFTATFISGIIETALGVLRLGILVDFLSHSTITGFMGGTAVIIILQQLKGFLGLKHFTTKTDVISVIKTLFSHRNEWHWESAVVGIIFLAFLQFTRYVKNKRPKLFWISAMAPLVVVITGGLFAYLAHAEKFGIDIVGQLKRGINPPSVNRLNFDLKYIAAPIKAGIITAVLALAEGIAIGRSFAIMKNQQTDGNKEMIAFGIMNIVGSFTSCYLTTGPFSKTAVNFNAGCKTQMSNVVMAIIMMLTLLLLAPLFSYTPMVALSAIIMSAMFGLIEYDKAIHLFKVDKFDFSICMLAFFGVTFISMDVGLALSIALGIIRALLYTARPRTCKLGNIPSTNLYRDMEQYPDAQRTPGILILQLGSPILYSNNTYIRERVLRWIRDEEIDKDNQGDSVEHLILEIGGVTTTDMTGIEALYELKRLLVAKNIELSLVNPRIEVMEKLIASKFIDVIGKQYVYLSIDDAVESCRFRLSGPNKCNGRDQP
ncbi:probable sulfate transporter 3.5 isoform X1 [Amaranthus tricolor]|uniref:probable sulfate transporter 3.5 isoform X1 n=1 Tax=Amaranthus tricolor TaxID=29722 RepID=UPI00258B2740|nr:probable sulfate transporter 3.5 isoform X1 [Amaranthus tricolor]